MTTQDVYKQFGTPSNLQNHMLSVTSLICEVRDHWTDEEIDWNSLIIAGLLHDLGNVIKFDLDKFPELLGAELPRIEFWREEQQRLIAKYGNDDHEATGKMLDELGVNDRIKDVIQTKSFGNIRTTAASTDWLPKILQYCDLRVSPYGLMGLGERMQEIKERYGKYASRPDFAEMVEAAKALEDEISNAVSDKIETILTSSSLEKHHVSLRNYTIKSI
jgi:hypothetical protein